MEPAINSILRPMVDANSGLNANTVRLPFRIQMCMHIARTQQVMAIISSSSYHLCSTATTKAMCQKRPRSTITDGDKAMIRALRQVVPIVKHCICSWRVERNIKKHLY